MKRIISAITVLIFITSCTATKKTTSLTESQNTIKSDFTSYLEFIVNKEFAKSMEYIIPEIFELVSKEQMLQIMEQTFNNPEMEIKLEEPKILKIGKVAEVEEKFYSKLAYSNIMKMKIFGEEEETKEDKEMRINFLKLSFEQTFGTENVKYNSETGFFQIYSEKDVIAVSENGKSSWKFLVIEEKQKAMLEKLVPEKVLRMK